MPEVRDLIQVEPGLWMSESEASEIKRRARKRFELWNAVFWYGGAAIVSLAWANFMPGGYLENWFR